MVDLSWFRGRQQRQLSLHDKPARERHIVSIVFSCLSILALVLSLSLQEWSRANGGKCTFVFKLTEVVVDNTRCAMTKYYTTSQQILISCVISVSALAMVSSIIATFISSGFPREKMEFLRHYAVFNVVSLMCIVLVAGLWLGVSLTLPTDQQCWKGTSSIVTHCGVDKSRVETKFGYAYYVMLVGGLFSLIAAAFNLLFARSAADRRRSVRSRFRQQSQRHRLDRPFRQLPGAHPPAYSLLDSTDFSETETETSLSEMESEPPADTEPITPPPAYSP